jgi:predicted MFS family arabinose efflux permease
MSTPASLPSAAPRAPLFSMALATGLAVANIYYNQPMLGVMADSLGDARVSAWIPALTQAGYAAGLLLLLPLGDMVERRRLIVVQFVALALALALTAASPGLATLALGSVLVGATATVAQQIVPFTTVLCAPEKRGAAIGTVMSGLFTGILLSRTVAGALSGVAGWRAVFWIAVPVALGAAALMAWRLPTHVPAERLRYRTLLASLWHLWRDEPRLRRAASVQALLFAAFSAFWTVLSLHLAEPPLHLGATAAGLFGIVGAVGVAMAPVAGRVADRHGPAWVIRLGALATLLSWIVLGAWPGIAGLVVGVIVLDFGVQIALVSHQHLIYGLHPAFKSRLNTLFMTSMFIGGALGSWGAAMVWHAFGWHGVALLGVVLPAIGLLLTLQRVGAPAVLPTRE